MRWLRRELPLGPILVATTVAVVAVWWLWPSWSGADRRLDVVVLGDPGMAAGANTIVAALHGDGRTAVFEPPVTDWCSAAPAVAATVADRRPEVVVLTFAALGACGAAGVPSAVAAAGGRKVVVVVQPGDAAAFLGGGVPGARVVDPGRLVGSTAQQHSMPCNWWDDCPPSGRVDTRDASGRLTDAGFSRLARMLVPVV